MCFVVELSPHWTLFLILEDPSTTTTNAINVYTHYKFQETTSDTNNRLWIPHSSVIVCAHQIG